MASKEARQQGHTSFRDTYTQPLLLIATEFTPFARLLLATSMALARE